MAADRPAFNVHVLAELIADSKSDLLGTLSRAAILCPLLSLGFLDDDLKMIFYLFSFRPLPLLWCLKHRKIDEKNVLGWNQIPRQESGPVSKANRAPSVFFLCRCARTRLPRRIHAFSYIAFHNSSNASFFSPHLYITAYLDLLSSYPQPNHIPILLASRCLNHRTCILQPLPTIFSNQLCSSHNSYRGIKHTAPAHLAAH